MATLAREITQTAQLIWWASWLRLRVSRTALSTTLVGIAITAMAFNPTPYASMWPFLFIALLCMVTVITIGEHDIPNRVVFASAIVIALTALIAWPLSNIVGWQHPLRSGAMALWSVLMVLLLTVRLKPNLWAYVLPVTSLHAALTFIQALRGIDRPPGIMDSPNQAGALLLLGVIIAITTKPPKWWLVGIFAFALPFTGTRLSLYVGLAMLMFMAGRFLYSHAPKMLWRILIVLLGTGAAFGFFWTETSRAFLPTSAAAIEHLEWSLWIRIVHVPQPAFGWLGIIPHGYLGDYGAHSLPLRLWYESGALALIAWMGLTVYGLSRALWSMSWWLLLTMTFLASLDYYGNMPTVISLIWWVSIGLQTRSHRHA